MTRLTITDAELLGDSFRELELIFTAQDKDVTRTASLIIVHRDQKVAVLGQKAMTAMANACGIQNPQDTSDFVGKDVLAVDWENLSEVRSMQSAQLFGVERGNRKVPQQAGLDKFVYVISCVDTDPPRTKIGIASSPEKRLQQLSTSSPHALRLEFSRFCPLAGEVEQAAHRAFSQSRRNGEWFEIKAQPAIDFIVSHTRTAA